MNTTDAATTTTTETVVRTGSHSAGRRPRRTIDPVAYWIAVWGAAAIAAIILLAVLGHGELSSDLANFVTGGLIVFILWSFIGATTTWAKRRTAEARKAAFDAAFQAGYDRRRVDEHREWLDNFIAEQDARDAAWAEKRARWDAEDAAHREKMEGSRPFDQEN